MTISTPQPEYINETMRVVDEALNPAPVEEVGIKLVPTSADWGDATIDVHGRLTCPVCYSMVDQDAIRRHTDWHETLAAIAYMTFQS